MAHGKETPRQKMIGMMYLVLTALLALNVSKEVLNAFVLVDNGLTKTTKNFVEKNDVIYKRFDQAAIENPAKATSWKNLAYEVKQKADDLNKYIQELKFQIVKKEEGENTPAIVNGEIDGMKIVAKDDKNVPGDIMIVKGKGVALKASIADFRTFLLGNVKENAESVKASIEKSLDTNPPPPPKKGPPSSWEYEHFEDMPLIGVITVLSAMQGNVRNAEAEMLNYLYSQIDAGAFKFNQLEAVVTTNSNYIVKGNTYEANLFIAAFDTTQPPRILIGSYDTKTFPDGTQDYTMKGSYDSIRTFVKGKGVYKLTGSSIGERKWSGLIVLKSPTGGADIKKPFNASYMVAEPSVTVSPTKMNVFYLGVDNPVDIAASGFGSEKIQPTISQGSIRSVGKGSYNVNPNRPGNAIITVFAEIDGQKRNMGFKEFRVRQLPDPVVKVADKKSGGIDKNVLLAQTTVVAELEGTEFDAPFTVTEFTVSVTQSGFTYEEAVRGNKITDKQRSLIKNLTRGSRVYFQDIKASGPEGSIRSLGTINFKIN